MVSVRAVGRLGVATPRAEFAAVAAVPLRGRPCQHRRARRRRAQAAAANARQWNQPFPSRPAASAATVQAPPPPKITAHRFHRLRVPALQSKVSPMVSLNDLRSVMDASRDVPEEKRQQYLERIAAMLTVREALLR